MVFPDRNPIFRPAVERPVKRFEDTGSVKDRLKTGRLKLATNDEVALEVLQSVVEDPHASTTAIARQVDISQTSVCRILHKNKFHPYKIHLVHELNVSDKATFMMNRNVNRHNYRLWSDVNPIG